MSNELIIISEIEGGSFFALMQLMEKAAEKANSRNFVILENRDQVNRLMFDFAYCASDLSVFSKWKTGYVGQNYYEYIHENGSKITLTYILNLDWNFMRGQEMDSAAIFEGCNQGIKNVLKSRIGSNYHKQ